IKSDHDAVDALLVSVFEFKFSDSFLRVIGAFRRPLLLDDELEIPAGKKGLRRVLRSVLMSRLVVNQPIPLPRKKRPEVDDCERTADQNRTAQQQPGLEST